MPPEPSHHADLIVGDPAGWSDAISTVGGPQLVVAGPGTGKTQFLADRAVHLLGAHSADPVSLVILTFSRRAAAELSSRIASGLGTVASGLDVSTFHSFAHRLLETHGDDEIGTLLTGPEQIQIVSTLLSDEDPEGWPIAFRSLLATHTFAEETSDFLLRCRERLIDPSMLESMARQRPEWRAIPGFFRRYDAHLREERRLDYGTLLSDAISCLRRADVATAVAGVYRYVLVDEYQDTSPAQAALLSALTSLHGNITAAGDPYQSIYSFRGADLGNMAAFGDRFGTRERPARRIVLARSFRVPKAIMDGAVRVTAGGSLPGAAGRVEPAPHDGRIDSYVFDQQSAEAEWIAGEVERLLVEERLPPARIGILVRSKRRLLPELSRALDRRGVPHDKPDSRLVDHPAVRIILDLAKAAALGSIDAGEYPAAGGELDRTVRRLLLGPLFGLSIMAERDLVRQRIRDDQDWSHVLRDRLPDAAGVAELLADPSWAFDMSAAEGFWHAWTSVVAFRRIAVDPDRSDDRHALAAFAQALNRQADRDAHLSLVEYAERAEADDFEATPLLIRRDTTDRVALTTLHQAKGLEFDVVFIADATEGVFPDASRPRSFLQPDLLADPTVDAASRARFRLQEETRLAYTAITRARSRVVWTSTSAGVDEGSERPSRFLLAVAGTERSGVLSPAPGRSGRPVSLLEVETALRRTLVDPEAPPARRLAATSVLAHPPLPEAWSIDRFAGASAPGPDRGLITAPLVLSPSQAESYESCPRKHALERRLRLLEPDSPYLDFGSLIHRVLERVERAAMAEHRLSTLPEAMSVLDEEIHDDAFGTPPLRRAWRSRAQALLDRLYAEWPVDSLHAVALERPLSVEIDGVLWRGRADRIELTANDTLRIVDYKSGSSTPPRADAATSLQLGFYMLAARSDPALARYPAPTAAELWYPLASNKGWRLPFDTAQLDAVIDRMAAIARDIAAERWDARVGGRCARCPVRIVCDRWPEGREAFVE